MTDSLYTHYGEKINREQLQHDEQQVEALEKLQQVFDNLIAWRTYQDQTWLRRLMLSRSAPQRPRGIYLYGDVGQGKSMLMDLFYDNLPLKGKRRIHFHAFMQDIHAQMHEARQNKVEDPLAAILDAFARTACVLCLDEIQITDITDAMLVGRVFSELMARNVVIVATSNRVPEDLYKNGLNRHLFLPFIGLIRSDMEVYCLDGAQDYRMLSTDIVEVYITPEDIDALDHMWEIVIAAMPETERVLLVEGRRLTLPRCAGSCTRLTFSEACEQPRSAADYLRLAETFHTLVLDNVPRLSPENANAAKRFVTLVDALYEAKCMLICTAACTPDELYQEGKGTFEFERTVSRLHEMRSREYLEASKAPYTL